MSSELQKMINTDLPNYVINTTNGTTTEVKPMENKVVDEIIDAAKINESKEPATDTDSGGNVDVKNKKVSWFKKLYEEKMSERLIACKDSKTQQHAIWEYAFEMISKFAVSAFKASVWSGAITAIALALIASDQFGILLGLLQIK